MAAEQAAVRKGKTVRMKYKDLIWKVNNQCNIRLGLLKTYKTEFILFLVPPE